MPLNQITLPYIKLHPLYKNKRYHVTNDLIKRIFMYRSFILLFLVFFFFVFFLIYLFIYFWFSFILLFFVILFMFFGVVFVFLFVCFSLVLSQKFRYQRNL